MLEDTVSHTKARCTYSTVAQLARATASRSSLQSTALHAATHLCTHALYVMLLQLEPLMQGDWGQQKCKHYMTFDRWSPLDDTPEDMQCRIVAMLPGGPVATMLAGHPVVMKVGDTLLAHAGVFPCHLDTPGGLQGINDRAREWLRGNM
eukprot:15368-Heterococcus_DN1.PRE.1